MGHPWARDILQFFLKVLGTILSTYSVPSRWSDSCCKTRTCQPDAFLLIGSPYRSKPSTSTTRYRSTTTRNPSTLQNVIADDVNVTWTCVVMHTLLTHKSDKYRVSQNYHFFKITTTLKRILPTPINNQTNSIKSNQDGGKTHSSNGRFTIRGLDNDNKRFDCFVTHAECPLWWTEPILLRIWTRSSQTLQNRFIKWGIHPTYKHFFGPYRMECETHKKYQWHFNIDKKKN